MEDVVRKTVMNLLIGVDFFLCVDVSMERSDTRNSDKISNFKYFVANSCRYRIVSIFLPALSVQPS